jgi:isoamylase
MSWYDWRLAERNAGLRRFVSRLIALRKAHPVLSAEAFYSEADIRWFGVDGRAPEWHGRENRIGCMILEQVGGSSSAICLLFNAAFRPCRFVLPRPPAGEWRIAVDTAQVSPADVPDPGGEKAVADVAVLTGRSCVILTC